MSRKDTHLDAMLRHLGAAYYDSLYGRAAPADVTRALDTVAEHIGEQSVHRPAAARPGDGGQQARGARPQHHGRWHSRVRDVMTTSVVTVDRITPYKEIARALAENKVSGVPVLTMGRHVAGVVSEGDLIAAEAGHPTAGAGRHWWLRWRSGRKQRRGLTAGELMTSPALTIHPDATISAAARQMNAHHVRRLPVVDAEGKLIGIVSRRDLIGVFLRPDAEIAAQVGEILAEILPIDTGGIKVAVHGGVVILSGQPELTGQHDLLPLAMRLAWDIDGVVDVIDKIGPAPASATQAS